MKQNEWVNDKIANFKNRMDKFKKTHFGLDQDIRSRSQVLEDHQDEYKMRANHQHHLHDGPRRENAFRNTGFVRDVNARHESMFSEYRQSELTNRRLDKSTAEWDRRRYGESSSLTQIHDKQDKDFSDERMEAAFDEPEADYDQQVPLTNSKPKHNVRHTNDFSDTPRLYVSRENFFDSGRDNPVFTFELEDNDKLDRKEDGRRELGKAMPSNLSESVYFSNTRHKFQHESTSSNEIRRQYERERYTMQEQTGRYDSEDASRDQNESDSDESFVVDKRDGRSWSVRRRHRSCRATIASPNELHMLVKTLQRRKSARPRSEMIHGSHAVDRIADHPDSIFKEIDNDENKLPSNRNVRTKSLKQRIETLHRRTDVSTHDFADSLR